MTSHRELCKSPSVTMRDFDEFFGEEEEKINTKTDQVISLLQQQGLAHRVTLDKFVDVDHDDVEVESIRFKENLSYFSNAKREGIFFFFFFFLLKILILIIERKKKNMEKIIIFLILNFCDFIILLFLFF